MPEPDFTDALVFTGGGTGGHFFPAIALAEGARKRWPLRPIAFVGADRGIEARKLPGSPWPHLLLDVEGFLGRSPFRMLKAAWKLRTVFLEVRRRFRQQRPAAVIGTGGYAAAPALLAARSLAVPYFLHESNAAPGALVKILAPGARRVWCGMEAVLPLLPRADRMVAGTPVRESFLRTFSPTGSLPPPPRILVLGGSGGARALNEAVLALAPALLERFPEWEIVHQTGEGEFSRLATLPRHPRHALVPFIEAMDLAMEGSRLLLSRAGAATCAELRAAGRGAILVPLPGSALDHQRRNALAMQQEGRALMVEQGEGFPERLAERASELMAHPARLEALELPEPNRAVEVCLDDLAALLGL
jgi:UDP-N-acetylglucosamine--N-acetylmuramyl-(pentapeptide) pyrophosphoryl-undecaprenol N-acetylglucosamine transferase